MGGLFFKINTQTMINHICLPATGESQNKLLHHFHVQVNFSRLTVQSLSHVYKKLWHGTHFTADCSETGDRRTKDGTTLVTPLTLNFHPLFFNKFNIKQTLNVYSHNTNVVSLVFVRSRFNVWVFFGGRLIMLSLI